MTCTFDRELLALYTNGDATTMERDTVEAHLKGCPACDGIVTQYQQLASEVAGAMASVLPPGEAKAPAMPRRRWWVATTAAAAVLLLFGAMQVPAVAAQVARLYPFMAIFELDKGGLREFLRQYNESSHEGTIYYPEVFQTVAEAEAAWGGPIPQPTALSPGMELYRIDLFGRASGRKSLTLYYTDRQAGGNVGVRLSTEMQQRMVPGSAISETRVNGKTAVVIKGTFGQYPGEPLKWEPDSNIHLFFTLDDLHVEVFTAGDSTTLAELVQVAESLR